jgi:DNA-binding response OmpR family regulator
MPPPVPAGTVLVVDDEELVRSIATAILQRAGYVVLPVGDPDDAVETFRRAAGRVDVVVLDLTLPGRSGADVLAELRAIDPGVRVLISSGLVPDSALLTGPTGYLPKPFDVASLTEAVRRLRE